MSCTAFPAAREQPSPQSVAFTSAPRPRAGATISVQSPLWLHSPDSSGFGAVQVKSCASMSRPTPYRWKPQQQSHSGEGAGRSEVSNVTRTCAHSLNLLRTAQHVMIRPTALLFVRCQRSSHDTPATHATGSNKSRQSGCTSHRLFQSTWGSIEVEPAFPYEMV